MKISRMGLFLVSGLLVASCAAPNSQLGSSSSGKAILGGQSSANDRFQLMSQEPVCIPCEFTTFTQGGWQAPDQSEPGTVRVNLFNSGFTTFIGIDGVNEREFNTAASVLAYLPGGGTSGAIPNEGTLGRQVLVNKLNVAVNPGLDQVIIVGYDPDGDSNDNTIAEFISDADTALGGGGLPSGYDFSELNEIATLINEFFHDEEEPTDPIGTDGRTFECPEGGVVIDN